MDKYLKQKNAHSNYIDYYQLFGINQKLSFNEARNQSRKLMKYYHPDQVILIEDCLKDFFTEFSEVSIKMNDVFETEEKKAEYDLQLEIEKSNSNSYDTNDYDVEATESYDFGKSGVYDDENNESQYADSSSNRKLDSDKKSLEKAIETTIYKHGFYQGYLALQGSVMGIFSHVTSDNNSRKLIEKMGADRIKEILEANRKDIMDTDSNNMVMDFYCDVIVKTGLREKADVFHDACIETYKKYDLDVNHDQTYNAILGFLSYGSIDYFTRDNQAKEKLIYNNFTGSDVKTLISADLYSNGSKDYMYLLDNIFDKSYDSNPKILDLLHIYCNGVKEKAKAVTHKKAV